MKKKCGGELMKLILIDSGTTNSRIRLVDESSHEIIDALKLQVGVRITAIEGNNSRLKQAIQSGIQEILTRNGMTSKEVRNIVASGMITSNLGLYEVPHVPGPASLEDFAQHSKRMVVEEFLNIPCILVPGMKNNTDHLEGTIANLNQFDVMRGEEVETFGLLEQISVKGKGIMVLPGSHTKYVEVQDGNILTSCLSTLAGELLQAVKKETILSSSLDMQLIESIDADMLLEGYRSAAQVGFTRSLYQVRLIQLFSESDSNKRANFLVGAVLYNDIQSLIHSIDLQDVNWMIIGGSSPLRKAFVHLLQYTNKDWKVIEATDKQVEDSLVYGALAVLLKHMSLTPIKK